MTRYSPPGTRYVVRPCDEPGGSRTWDVLEITPGERELARREERPAGVVIAQAFRSRALARSYATHERIFSRPAGAP